MNKPYINLPEGYPGIVGLFMFDRELSKGFTSIGQTLMRRPSPLSVHEREVLFAWASKLNECKFCAGSHTACAKYVAKTPEEFMLVFQVLEKKVTVSEISDKIFYLLLLVQAVVKLDRPEIELDIKLAKAIGFTDQAIHDAVAIAAFACMCNRYVDGLGTTYKEEDLNEGGLSLAIYGYKMTFRRFFEEILPKMWSRWFPSKDGAKSSP